MKVWATMALALVLCGFAQAAPIGVDGLGQTPTIETGNASNRHQGGVFSSRECDDNNMGGGGGGGTGNTVPEPASMALLGIGLGLAGLARRKK